MIHLFYDKQSLVDNEVDLVGWVSEIVDDHIQKYLGLLHFGLGFLELLFVVLTHVRSLP